MPLTILNLSEWRAQAEKKFGKDPKQWKFKCSKCGGTQSLQDFIDAKVSEPDKKFYFSCIGRWVVGRGCDWTLGGFLQLHKTAVVNEDGDKIPVFEFAD